MFTWICPQCGREVPPSYTECPNCTKKTAGSSMAAAPPPPSAQVHTEPPPEAVAPPESAPIAAAPLAPPIEPPAPPAPSFQHALAPARRSLKLPVWLATVLSAVLIVGIVAGVYWLVGYFQGGHPAKPSAAVESPAAKPGAAANPLQRFIEVSSVRFLEDPKKKEGVLVRFVVTNHSEAELNGLAGNVTIWGSTGRSEEDAEGTFEFTTSLKGFESKELTGPLMGKKKIYEMPDWTNMTTDVQITAPTS